MFSVETFPWIAEGKKNAVSAQKTGEKLKLQRSLRHGGHVWERPKHRLSARAGEVGPRKHLPPRRSGSLRPEHSAVYSRVKTTFNPGEGWIRVGIRASVCDGGRLFVLCKKCVCVCDPAEGSGGGLLQ